MGEGQEGYQPGPEEISEAESRMTVDQEKMSHERQQLFDQAKQAGISPDAMKIYSDEVLEAQKPAIRGGKPRIENMRRRIENLGSDAVSQARYFADDAEAINPVLAAACLELSDLPLSEKVLILAEAYDNKAKRLQSKSYKIHNTDLNPRERKEFKDYIDYLWKKADHLREKAR